MREYKIIQMRVEVLLNTKKMSDEYIEIEKTKVNVHVQNRIIDGIKT